MLAVRGALGWTQICGLLRPVDVSRVDCSGPRSCGRSHPDNVLVQEQSRFTFTSYVRSGSVGFASISSEAEDAPLSAISTAFRVIYRRLSVDRGPGEHPASALLIRTR